jgi:hypothetical protein
MSERRDLFPETVPPAGPLPGLAVTLPDACRCGSQVARIGPPRGPHLAELRCCTCEQHRGWLPREAHQFVSEVVAKFGRPTEPIAIQRSRRP